MRTYLTIAVACARVSEATFVKLMVGDRLLLHTDKLWNIIEDDMQYLLRRPASCWKYVPSVLQVCQHDLRMWVVDASIASCGWTLSRIWRAPLGSSPWATLPATFRL